VDKNIFAKNMQIVEDLRISNNTGGFNTNPGIMIKNI